MLRLRNIAWLPIFLFALLFGPISSRAQTDFTSVKPAKEFWIDTPYGAKLSAQEWGNPDGPVVIFIHGFLQSHLSWWKQVIDQNLAKKFRMITFDITGHGGSDKPWDKSIYDNGDKWADMLSSVLDAAGPKKPVVVGWSYGSRIIGDYLNKYGDSRLAGINFVGSALIGDRKMFGDGIALLGKALVDDIAQNVKATREFNKACFEKQPSDADLDQMTMVSMATPIKVRQWARRPAEYEKGLVAIKVPVLVTHGVQDRVCLLDIAKYVAGKVPHAKASYYEGVGHSPFWEDAPRFNRELNDLVTQAAK